MRVGQLDRVVQLEKRGPDTRPVSGSVVQTWQVILRDFASRRDTLGTERVAAGVEQTMADAVFRVRWRPDVSSATRLVCEGQTWDIMAVAELGRHQWLDLTCRRVTI